MLFALVAISLSPSFGSITVEAHPSARLLAQAEVQLPTPPVVTLHELEDQLEDALHEPTPYIAPAILFGLAAVNGLFGAALLIPVSHGLSVLGPVVACCLAAGVLLCLAIAGVIIAAVVQGQRERDISALREDIARRKRSEPLPAAPPSAQSVSLVSPQFALAHF